MRNDDSEPFAAYCFGNGVGEIAVLDWSDHLEIRSATGVEYVALELIGRVSSSAEGVTITFDGGQVCIPVSAFEGAHDMDAYAFVLDQRRRAAPSFQGQP